MPLLYGSNSEGVPWGGQLRASVVEFLLRRVKNLERGYSRKKNENTEGATLEHLSFEREQNITLENKSPLKYPR